MKRFFCLTLCVLLLCSCSAQGNGEPFSVFEADFEANVSSYCEGNKCEFFYDKNSGKITFLSPHELDGYTLSRDAEALKLSYDGISVQVSEYAGRLLLICEYVFSAESDDVVNISANKSGADTVTVVKTDNCEYFFDSNGVPLSVKGSYDGINFEFVFSSFEVLSNER